MVIHILIFGNDKAPIGYLTIKKCFYNRDFRFHALAKANFLYTSLNYSYFMLKPHGFVVSPALLSLL